MSPQQESVYLSLMMDVYRRLRDSENSHRYVRDIVGKSTPELQKIACVQLYLVTNVHAFAPDDHPVLQECGGRFFDRALIVGVDEGAEYRDLSYVIAAQTDEERLTLAMKIAPRIVELEQSAFGIYDEV